MDDLGEHLRAARAVVKAAIRSNRTALQVLTDLDEKLEALQTAQPEEGTANGTKQPGEASRVIAELAR